MIPTIRAARSEATARIVGIIAGLADVRTSTLDAPSRSGTEGESRSDTLAFSFGRGLSA
jgi:hypothetical protein